tara:strand:- start:781 stop:969 length:189 start_codon:yes stop_codon:yes gene_type:complete
MSNKSYYITRWQQAEKKSEIQLKIHPNKPTAQTAHLFFPTTQAKAQKNKRAVSFHRKKKSRT